MIDQTDHRAVEIEPNVEIVPTWEDKARLLVVILRDGTPEGKAHAAREFIRMGQIIDRLQGKGGTKPTGPDFPL